LAGAPPQTPLTKLRTLFQIPLMDSNRKGGEGTGGERIYEIKGRHKREGKGMKTMRKKKIGKQGTYL